MATRVRRLPEVGSPASGELAPAGQASLAGPAAVGLVMARPAGRVYLVLEPLRHDGVDYAPGDRVTLAAPLPPLPAASYPPGATALPTHDLAAGLLTAGVIAAPAAV